MNPVESPVHFQCWRDRVYRVQSWPGWCSFWDQQPDQRKPNSDALNKVSIPHLTLFKVSVPRDSARSAAASMNLADIVREVVSSS